MRKSSADLKLSVGSLFSGIGGFDLGLERAGMRVEWQCENDPFCQAVLRRHWPDTTLHTDVRRKIEFAPVDVLCGGFPCQPVSNAGIRLGADDPRWLWSHFHRVIDQLKPKWVIIENVEGLRTKGLGTVLEGLAQSGYDAEWDRIPAVAVGANHRRSRYFIVAYPEGSGRHSRPCVYWEPPSGHNANNRRLPATASDAKILERLWRESSLEVASRGTSVATGHGWWAVEPIVGRVGYGIPDRVDRLKSLGNSIVPQVAEWLGRRIITANAP